MLDRIRSELNPSVLTPADHKSTVRIDFKGEFQAHLSCQYFMMDLYLTYMRASRKNRFTLTEGLSLGENIRITSVSFAEFILLREQKQISKVQNQFDIISKITRHENAHERKNPTQKEITEQIAIELIEETQTSTFQPKKELIVEACCGYDR